MMATLRRFIDSSKTKATRQGFPAEIRLSKEQQDCPRQSCVTRNPTLLRRNIVCKRPEATAPLATFRSAVGAGTYWRNASLAARIYPYRTKYAKTSRRGADDARRRHQSNANR